MTTTDVMTVEPRIVSQQRQRYFCFPLRSDSFRVPLTSSTVVKNAYSETPFSCLYSVVLIYFIVILDDDYDDIIITSLIIPEDIFFSDISFGVSRCGFYNLLSDAYVT